MFTRQWRRSHEDFEILWVGLVKTEWKKTLVQNEAMNDGATKNTVPTDMINWNRSWAMTPMNTDRAYYIFIDGTMF